jgi:putative tricarboxylic transport membrane protein
MKKYDQMSSLLWLALAFYIGIESLRLPLGSWRDPGPGFLPLGAGIGLAILSLTVFSQARFRTEERTRQGWYSPERWKSLLVILGVLFGYALFLDFLGFLVSTFLLLVMLFRFVEPQRWVVAIGGSALASIASYIVFEVWLKTQLPKGIFGI